LARNYIFLYLEKEEVDEAIEIAKYVLNEVAALIPFDGTMNI
jgi:hypothetical protein